MKQTFPSGSLILSLGQDEERFKQLVQNADDIIFSCDRFGNFGFVNPMGLKITGYSEEEIVKKKYFELVLPEFVDHVKYFFEAQLREQKSVTYFEFPIVTKDGSIVWIGQSTTLVKSADSQIMFQGIARDISDRKRIESELIEARQLAEAGNRAKTEFLARMSHEIRTPINAIVGYTELLLDEELTGEQREALETVKLSTNTLMSLVDDVLDLSRVEADKVEFDSVPFNLESVIMDACEMVRGRMGDHRTEILCDLHDVPDYLVGDPVRLRQIFTNLLGNAVKFTKEGEILIKGRCIGTEGSKVNLEASVQDTGIGIPESMLTEIFEPFTQACKSDSQLYGGAGLGLAICKKLIGLMGGNISVESSPDIGSKFTFNVWLKSTESDTEVPIEPMSMAELSGKTALLVDDNETSLRILEATLNRVGIQSVSVTSGRSALEMLASKKFDLGLLDIRMPEMDGYELVEAICKDFIDKCPKAIALSSEPQWRERTRLSKIGFDGYLMKPVRRNQLYSMIRTVLGISSKSARPLGQHFLKPVRPCIREILLAEDNPINQRITIKMLSKIGLNTDLAHNGAEAVQKACSKTYDLILMDVQMPIKDGLSATREIRSCGVQTPIVAITASAMKGDREMCLDAGMDEYISKPIRYKNMLQVLEQFCSMEINPDVPDHVRVLLANKDEDVTETIRKTLTGYLPDFTMSVAESNVDTCIKLGSFMPHIVILNSDIAGLELHEISRVIKTQERLSNTRLLVLDGDGLDSGDVHELRNIGVTEILSLPLREEDLLNSMEHFFSSAAEWSKVCEIAEDSTANMAARLDMELEDYLDLRREFVSDVSARLEFLETALANQDYVSMKQAAHAIKGGSAEMMFQDMADSAARIEACAMVGDLTDCRHHFLELRGFLEKLEE